MIEKNSGPEEGIKGVVEDVKGHGLLLLGRPARPGRSRRKHLDGLDLRQERLQLVPFEHRTSSGLHPIVECGSTPL